MEIKDKSLEGKRILFLSPAFFNYEKKIVEKMKSMGAAVDFYDERVINKPFEKALIKVLPTIFNKKSKVYYNNILNAHRNDDYDYILIVKCDMVPEETLQQLKHEFKSSKLILYLWDSLKNIPNITHKLKYFDKVYSFDRIDVLNNNGMIFRPLFFADEFYRNEESTNEEPLYDLCFCGTIHSDRYKIIREFEEFCEINNMKFYKFMYLQSKFIYWFYWLTKKEFKKTNVNDFDYEKRDSAEIADIISKSHIVLDIQHPNQTGLTMRTIEMLGMKKKLITTNNDVVNYNCFHSNNILVIDRNTLYIPEQFLKQSYQKTGLSTYNYYCLEYWIREVLGLECI